MGTFRNFQLSTIIKTSLVFLSLVLFSSCKMYHMYTKKEALKYAKKLQKRTKKYAAKSENEKNAHIEIEDNDRVLNVNRVDGSNHIVDMTYTFNKNNKQMQFSVIAQCHDCWSKLSKNQLNNKSYKWKRVNDSTYISIFYLKRMLHIHPSEFSYDIVKHNYSRKERRDMIKNAQ
jgi:hypothetical protein